ncbi:MAG: hypothetical protein IID43_06470 [Planctomycetes bacterium]|nr:hypothetical protein [Planctomycetota bacterium]
MRRRSFHKTGFTMVETLVSVATMALLMTGMGSAILIASNSLPDRGNPVDAAIKAADAVDQISAELRYASSISTASPTSIQFVVDRSGTDQTISYTWSAIPGDPLTRTYGLATPVDLIDDVYEFTLTYETAPAGTLPPVEQEGAEILLASYDTLVVASDYRVSSVDWVGQYFQPSLPADAVSWKVTRVKFMAHTDGKANGTTAVQLRTATAGNLPTTTVLEELLMVEATLSSSYLWQEFAFSTVSGRTPGEGLCLVLGLGVADNHMCQAQYDSGGGSGLVATADGGGIWVSAINSSMTYYVYGTVNTMGPPQGGEQQYRSVRIELRTGSHSSSRVESAVQILNQPDVP